MQNEQQLPGIIYRARVKVTLTTKCQYSHRVDTLLLIRFLRKRSVEWRESPVLQFRLLDAKCFGVKRRKKVEFRREYSYLLHRLYPRCFQRRPVKPLRMQTSLGRKAASRRRRAARPCRKTTTEKL